MPTLLLGLVVNQVVKNADCCRIGSRWLLLLLPIRYTLLGSDGLGSQQLVLMLGLCGEELRQWSRQDCQLLVVLSLVRDVIRHSGVHD